MSSLTFPGLFTSKDSTRQPKTKGPVEACNYYTLPEARFVGENYKSDNEAGELTSCSDRRDKSAREFNGGRAKKEIKSR
jgi:hypothetical protein